MAGYAGRTGGVLSGDLDGVGGSTLDLISSGQSMQHASAVATRQAMIPGGGPWVLPWGNVGIGLVTLIVILLYLNGRIL